MTKPAEPTKGARCPECNSSFVPVSNTEPIVGGRVRRRRQCQHCGHKFVTTERPRPENEPEE